MNSKFQLVDPVPSADEELRQWLISHTEKHPHLTTNVLARADYIGSSRTALDAYITGTYFLPADAGGQGVDPRRSKLEDHIRRYRERVEGTVRHGFANTFVATRTWYQLEQACNTAIGENAIVVVYGKPGLGKTRSLTEYCVEKMRSTMPINILCSANITTRYFVQKLATSLGLDDKPPTARLEDNIAEKLKRSPRPIFVDQANYLKESALGTICYVWDIARVPVVLVGTKLLHDIFFSSRLTEDVRAQLSRRIAMHYPLDELTPSQAKAIITAGLGADATDENIAKIINLTGAIHGNVEAMIRRVLDLKKRNQDKLEAGEVTLNDIISTAGTKLMIA